MEYKFKPPTLLPTSPFIAKKNIEYRIKYRIVDDSQSVEAIRIKKNTI
jgi:hypothetical protein